ncbi:hypothetical protein HYP06_gp089 [Vibrio phage vB_VspP_pVa5]|uniref:Uncharacterized protein n=1 Tax=Vibrio phage vB_VspP_pVa5 TaxID=1913109 RepID=A0A1J0GV84_9CAUD|nr:hypothetical protein HYP06_gp089 [Vibrio phage vB_VspP_pVa5]APC46088.1 hypothetical protein vBVspPpVa5_0084 [Vibrio phage vB_VspP_pVa5]
MSDNTEPTASEMIEWLIQIGREDDNNQLMVNNENDSTQTMCTHCKYGRQQLEACGKCMFIGWDARYQTLEKILPMVKMLEVTE